MGPGRGKYAELPERPRPLLIREMHPNLLDQHCPSQIDLHDPLGQGIIGARFPVGRQVTIDDILRRCRTAFRPPYTPGHIAARIGWMGEEMCILGRIDIPTILYQTKSPPFVELYQSGQQRPVFFPALLTVKNQGPCQGLLSLEKKHAQGHKPYMRGVSRLQHSCLPFHDRHVTLSALVGDANRT